MPAPRTAPWQAPVVLACALWLVSLPACVGPRPDQDKRNYKVSGAAAFLGGRELLPGPRTIERVAAARELLQASWLAQPDDRDRLLGYARAAAWVAERQDAGRRQTGELLELSEVCEELGAHEPRADAYLFASILFGLFIETNQVTAGNKVPHVVELAKAAVALDGSIYQAWPHRVLGEVYRQAPPGISVGDLELALEHYEIAVELAPDFPDNWVGLGLVLWELGEDDEAKEAFLTALEVDPGEEWATEADEGRADAKEWLASKFEHVVE